MHKKRDEISNLKSERKMRFEMNSQRDDIKDENERCKTRDAR